MSTFEQALRMAGLHPRDVVADGRIRRCKTDLKPGKLNGWFVLHADGSGAWGDWTTGTGEALGHWRDEHSTQSAADLEAARRKVEVQRQAERAKRIQAIGEARRFWERCAPINRLHPYLERKGLSALGTRGLRTHDGLLVIPVLWQGRVISVQTIQPDGTKRFWTGAPVKGGSYVLDRPGAAMTVYCEGFATGLALYQACKQARVVVCFDAGNLLPVVERSEVAGSVVLAADNDHGTEARRGFNPGVEKARNAAEFIGVGVALPTGIEGTDWADALKEWGMAGAKRIERMVMAQARYVIRSAAA